MEFQASRDLPPIGALITFKAVKVEGINLLWGNKTCLSVNPDIFFNTNISITRYLARRYGQNGLYGTNVIQQCEVDHWLLFSLNFEEDNKDNQFDQNLVYLNKSLATVTFLIGNKYSIADFVLWGSLYSSSKWNSLLKAGEIPNNISRWYNLIKSLDCVKETLLSVPKNVAMLKVSDNSLGSLQKEEGKFIDLPGAEMGKVVVRFPPEASGFLHIGHAKAALLNQYYKEAFNGKLIMRFDDTNPAKEKVDFEKVILGDLELLQIKPDEFTHTSNYFDLILKYCEQLIKEGKAYVDDTDPETMKKEREQKTMSQNRGNSPEKNLQMWQEMKSGTDFGQKCCARAKIDMNSLNGCMRDPTIYRCKNEPHPRTGTLYKVYPTYDFACPIVDSIEGVTHCLRTMEYHDRDEQFYWFIDALNLRKPYIWEYSRLNMTNTVLSKRKLTWFVENHYVDGWDDPRFPTVKGILRRGMSVEGLKQFIIAQGSSRSVVVMEWDKIWAFNKKVIDPVAPRYSAVDATKNVKVLIAGVLEQSMSVAKHPKNPNVGEKNIWIGPEILVDRIDAEEFTEGANVTFINWGNIKINKIVKVNNEIKEILAETNLNDKDYKKTMKITWVANTKKVNLIPCVCVYFEHIISKAILGKDEDFKGYIDHPTKIEIEMLGDAELAFLKKSDVIQIQRKGFFICDSPYEPSSIYSGKISPLILFSIPDGHSKQNSMFGPCKSLEQHSQGDIVRDLKQKKSEKKLIDSEVGKLLPGLDCKPDLVLNVQQEENVTAVEISDKIKDQGDIIRQLKKNKAEKNEIGVEVQKLLKLKSEFKTVSGQEWAPNIDLKVNKKENNDNLIIQRIKDQGDMVRDLKNKSVEKSIIDLEVKKLLSLKAEYKNRYGKEWNVAPNSQSFDKEKSCHYDIEVLLTKISQQGDKIRKLKTEGTDKNVVAEEVKVLLELKSQFKINTGQDWKPDINKAALEISSIKSEISKPKENFNISVNDEIENITAKIKEQGDIVRNLKSSLASKEVINDQVQKLLALKSDFKLKTGTEFSPETKMKGKEKSKQKNQEITKQKNEMAGQAKKVTRLCLEAKKEENLPEWYSQVLIKGEMIEYFDVSGCYILRPWSYEIWEMIRNWFDNKIKALGVKNCYFPIFVSKSVLEKEKTHIADFAPEVAWVTKSGDSDLAEPIAIRPTSETVMYPSYAKWIQSYRDLPIKLNQWNNVVRWEFKHPQPFLRTREFLWQEGHTAFATMEEAVEEVSKILELYAQIYTDLLAIPVVKGRKTEKEKFAGGDFTLTIEAFISASGRAIQGATSHHLGQNFSKMFEIIFDDPVTQEKKFVFQNSWGITTRTIGVLIMVHSDNQGLVLPPKVASVQVVIVPCGISVSLKESEKQEILKICKETEILLKNSGIRVQGDYRDNYSPGWKFNHWELKGVPVRIEIGPKDLKENQVQAIRRDNGSKSTIQMDSIVTDLNNLLEDIQHSLLLKATEELKSHMITCKDWKQFCLELDKKNIILSPFCGEISCEDAIKQKSAREDQEDSGAPAMGAKGLCIPFDQPDGGISGSDRCINPECNSLPKFFTLFGRSY